MSKLSRTKWIEKMIGDGKNREEIVEALLKGDAAEDIKPMEGMNAKMFADLNYRKVFKKMKK